MALEQTRKAYEGKDSAYLLVYRRVLAHGTSLIADNDAEVPAPPEFWLEKVREMNLKLRGEREICMQRTYYQLRRSTVH